MLKYQNAHFNIKDNCGIVFHDDIHVNIKGFKIAKIKKNNETKATRKDPSHSDEPFALFLLYCKNRRYCKPHKQQNLFPIKINKKVNVLVHLCT